jgi:ATP-dependent Zn protease
MFAMRPGIAFMRSSGPDVSIVRVGILVLLLVVLGLALLYAYRSQTPSTPQVSVTQALGDINAGRIRAVVVAGNRATLEFRDNPSHKEQTTLPEPDTVLARSLLDYNAAHPSQTIEVRVDEGPPGPPLAGLIDLLPVLLIVLIGALIFSTMRRRSL